MTLLLAMLMTASAWAEADIYVGYLDPTAPIGQQRKTVLNPVWVDENTTEMGTADETTWYLVSGTFTNDTRIEVKGTVNLILTNGCNFTASEGIHVPSGSALNIYAQSVANRGSLTADNYALTYYAAIGGNGGEDAWGATAKKGEDAGDITIYGGTITTTNGNIGGGDGGNGNAWTDIYFDEFDNEYSESFAGNGGNGGNGNVTIYSGYVWVKSGNIGGGKAGTGQDENGGKDESYDGYNGDGTVNLSWANTSDRIYADNYYGTVTLQKAFYNIEDANIIDAGVVNDNDLLNRKNLIYAGDSYTVTIGSMPDGVTATADLVLSAGVKTAVVGQVVTISFSGVPDGKVPVVSVTYGNNNDNVNDIIDNGDGTFSFVMPNGTVTVTAKLTPIPVTVPELTVTDATATTADVSWTACNGVTSYTLQLASDEQFTTGGSTTNLSEDFSGFSGNGSTDIGGHLNDYTATEGWTGSKVYCNSEMARIGASSSQGWIMTPALDASGTLTVVWSAYRYATADNNTILLGVSENGTDFDEETIEIDDEMTEYTNTFNVSGPTVYVRWKASGSSKARFYLDDITIKAESSGSGGSLIAEETVTGTSYTFTGLTPETTYYARVKGNEDWSDVVNFTTTPAPESAPVWSAFPAMTINVDEDVDITISDYVTGNPTPSIALTSSNADADKYSFDDDFLTFIPSSAGTYTFTFTATNSEGSAVATLTITAAVTVPTLTIGDITATTADATWTACDDVTEYTIQLASDEQFSTGGSTTNLSEDFFYPYGWDFFGTGKYTDAKYCGSSSPSIKFDSTGDYAISPDFGSGTKLQFWAYGNGGSGSTFTISRLVNGSWTEIETVTIAQGAGTYEVNLPSGTSQVLFVFTRKVNCALDDVVVYGASSGGGSLIGEYTVTDGTSYTFTGLSPETTYYARVKGKSDWSEVKKFTTAAAVKATLDIELADNADNASVLKTNNGNSANVTLSGRTLWKDGDWNTLVLPFDVTIADSPLAGATVMELDVADKWEKVDSKWQIDNENGTSQTGLVDGTLSLFFKEATSIEAGKPYIIKWDKADNIKDPVFKDVTISNANSPVTSEDGKVQFKGTYDAITWETENKSILFLGTENTLYYPQAGASLGACRAYFELSNPNGVREFVMNFDEQGTQTVIGHTEITEITEKADAWYTVNGVKLEKEPTKKGMYIHGNRKVVINN